MKEDEIIKGAYHLDMNDRKSLLGDMYNDFVFDDQGFLIGTKEEVNEWYIYLSKYKKWKIWMKSPDKWWKSYTAKRAKKKRELILKG